MITKGIIMERVLNSNTYKVRIPYLERAGINDKNYLEAIVSHEPGIVDNYQVGDVVIVGFEDHNGDKPIILGKLLLNNDDSRGAANVDALDVSTSARLPQNTMIGDIDIYKLLSALQRGDGITNDTLNELLEIASTAGGGGGESINIIDLR